MPRCETPRSVGIEAAVEETAGIGSGHEPWSAGPPSRTKRRSQYPHSTKPRSGSIRRKTRGCPSPGEISPEPSQATWRLVTLKISGGGKAFAETADWSMEAKVATPAARFNARPSRSMSEVAVRLRLRVDQGYWISTSNVPT